MTLYVDGFVIPVPEDRMDEYLELARTASEVWREHGALSYTECVADDVDPGDVTSFPRSVHLQEGETVVFAWITYPSKEVRDQCNEKAMNDPRLAAYTPETLPLDGKRMFWGGFRSIIEA